MTCFKRSAGAACSRDFLPLACPSRGYKPLPRLVAVILGLVFLIVGVVLTVTIVGAIVGIPFIIFGLLLTVRGLF